MAQMVKNLPAMQETQLGSPGRKDSLEKGMATHTSILAWRIPWTEEPGGLYSPRGRKESDTTERLTLTHLQNCFGASLMTVKNMPAIQETWVRSLGRKDPLEKGMATHTSILAWRTPWTEEPGGLQSIASQRVGHD